MVGTTLPNDWQVVSPLNWELDANTGLPLGDGYGSGGNFGIPYVVQRKERKAFLKAITLHRLKGRGDIIQAMREVTDVVEFEREIHRVCADHRMDRVVQAVDGGQVSLGQNIEDQVPYIIMELADGDVRRRLRKIEEAQIIAWKMRAMHHAAVGLSQLHGQRIAHQDLKPSNLMSFDAESGFKLGDFGRSVRQGVAAPHEDFNHAGDPSYAPPELMYGELDPDWVRRRVGCDIYMLGGLLSWAFLGEAATPLLVQRLAPTHRPLVARGQWVGTYRDVLPFVRSSFTDLVSDFETAVPEWLREKLVPAFVQLTEPDPQLRGHPLERKSKHGSQFSLTRYISLFNTLAATAKLNAKA
ncbi:protein kinase family protein [Nitratireductor pacificus pht-3B]|uniref:Protein kinase family protein n=1 Tax=Nitratireductor pacificus pht-3B TaxID=391937 RepID=K2LS40_9HYPH|nr:protein kinase family protein [Nitratireductor pacificus pht-3B]